MKHYVVGCMTAAILFSAVSITVAATSSTIPPTTTLDACSIVATSDVDAAFAPRVFVIDNSGPTVPKLPAKFAQVSRCTFVSKGAKVRDMVVVTVSLRYAPTDETGTTIKMMKEGAIQLGATPVDVSDLGDGAYWANLGGPKRPNRQLNVGKGKRIWLTIGESSSKLSDLDAIANLTKVAQGALGKL